MDFGILPHLTQVVMHSCKREEMPMFGQSRTELPAAASKHHDQDHPYPITHGMEVLHQPNDRPLSVIEATAATLIHSKVFSTAFTLTWLSLHATALNAALLTKL